MSDTDGRIGGIYRLTSGSGRAEYIDAQIIGVDLDLHLFGLGQHRHGNRRSMNAALGLRGRHPLHAMGAALIFEAAVRPFALDHHDDLFKTAHAGGMQVHDLNCPMARFGVPAVHFI